MTIDSLAAQIRENARNRRNGQFGHAQYGVDPTLSLGAAPAPRKNPFDDLLEEHGVDTGNLVQVKPENVSEARRKLVNLRGEPGGAVRQVWIHDGNAPQNYPGEHIRIAGPKDGRPIVIHLNSGLPHLKVESGKAIVFADSRWGNSIDVADGAEAVVYGKPDTKISGRVDAGGKYTAVCTSSENRFFVHGGGDILQEFAEPAEPAGQPEEPAGPEAAERTCDECGEAIDESDKHCMDCKCTCGESLNDGEGYDGKCGTCADAAEDEDDDVDLVCSMELLDDDGDLVDFSIIRLEESRYEVESTGDPVLEFDYTGDEEAHDAIQEAALEALKLAGHSLTELAVASAPEVNDPEPSF